jgi:glycosyltransferase involved in cell wall biosynthesis
MNVSTVIITLNEEKHISACLNTLSFSNDIVVIDSYSQDKTVSIAQSFADTVIQVEKPDSGEGFDHLRQIGIDATEHEWIFLIDADERVPESLQQRIPRLIQADADAFKFPRKNLMWGKWIKGAGWWPDYELRLFRRDVISFTNQLHQFKQLDPDTVVSCLNPIEENAIEHVNHDDVREYIEQFNRYTAIEAGQTDFSLFSLIYDPIKHMYWRYVIESGWKLGITGVVLTLISGIYNFVIQFRAGVQQLRSYTDDKSYQGRNE